MNQHLNSWTTVTGGKKLELTFTQKNCKRRFTAAFFEIAQNWKETRFISTGEYLKKLVYSYHGMQLSNKKEGKKT